MDTTIQTPPKDIGGTKGDTWMAREATRMGFPIAGFVGDIYEDAVILIPSLFAFDWDTKHIKIGRVIHIDRNNRVRGFVLQLEDGTQMPCMYGRDYPCHFALPENTENFCLTDSELTFTQKGTGKVVRISSSEYWADQRYADAEFAQNRDKYEETGR